MKLTRVVFAKNKVLLRTAMASALAANAANGQSASSVGLSLSIDDPRPVAAAAMVLMSRHDLVITYEDAAYVGDSDAVDAISQVRSDRNVSSAAVSVPVGGRMDFEYFAPGEAGESTAMPAIVRTFLDYHALGGAAVRFRVSESGGYIHIVPGQVRDSTGSWAPYQPVLDARVTIESAGRNALEIIQDLLVAINTATGSTVVIGTAPINPLLQSRPPVDGDNRVAREILADLLSRVDGVPLTWMLFHDPRQRMFALNVLPAKMPDLPTHVPARDALPGEADPATARVRTGTD